MRFVHVIDMVIFLLLSMDITCFLVKFNVDDETRNRKSDIYLDSIQLIERYNYPVESHVVLTEDGYLLNTFRIPRNGPPVLLVHGIGDSSDSWLVLGPTSSLSFMLADAGFDVWIYNARGNRYSKKHVNAVPPQEFWDFSFEEMGTLDMPATIDYILERTNMKRLTYIGYSQGTTAFFIMCSTKPEYNDKINHAILLAPVAWLTHTKYPFIAFFNQILSDLMEFSEKRHVYEVFTFNKKNNFYHAKVCNTTASYSFLCHIELYLNFGVRNLLDLSPERLPVITSHIPAGVSVKTFFHFLQLYGSKRFQRFDYGMNKNRQIYSSLIPPEFNVSSITVPSSLFVSEIDWFSDEKDTNFLKNKLKYIERFNVINKSNQFTHLEFVYGTRVKEFINKPVINILKELKILDTIDIR
ncbi:unnamed protein product [Pieris macdunnoughi]|uniref:Lipase n=1 Tax=Pieris macdunnoughi TaxID=345717 RepID=A0A821PV96_9NEOP|nr:unnamed protein product [Pieris macdunnoughi]